MTGGPGSVDWRIEAVNAIDECLRSGGTIEQATMACKLAAPHLTADQAREGTRFAARALGFNGGVAGRSSVRAVAFPAGATVVMRDDCAEVWADEPRVTPEGMTNPDGSVRAIDPRPHPWWENNTDAAAVPRHPTATQEPTMTDNDAAQFNPAERIAGKPGAAMPQSPTVEALERLHERVAMLDKATHVLVERLGSVLDQTGPEPAPEPRKPDCPPPASPLIRAIDTATNNVAGNVRVLEALARRLTI